MVIYREVSWATQAHSSNGTKMTSKHIVDTAIEASVRAALDAVGLDVIKSEPFFGMGERDHAELKRAA